MASVKLKAGDYFYSAKIYFSGTQLTTTIAAGSFRLIQKRHSQMC